MKNILVLLTAVSVIIVIILTVLYHKGYFTHITEGFSGSFDPSLRMGIPGTGPVNDKPCPVCM